MVSTRGIKLKFSENERVLCYEPDPTKAKVLYDSKVLEAVITKEQRGRKSVVEYLIHFQGWNSSWDRYVSEEYVLKDTAENRQLQKDLAEQSQLQLGAYLYRKDRKKHGRKTSERTAPSSDDGSSGSPTRMDTDEGEPHGVTSSSEEDSSADEELVPVELPQELRDMLEHDFEMINSKHKLLKLPAEPNVVNILENYWQHYFNSQQNDSSNEKSRIRHPYLSNNVKKKPEDIQKNLKICREVLDGIRVYFDFTLNDLLLYKPEQNQVQTSPAQYSAQSQLMKDDLNNKHDVDYMDYTQSNPGEDGYLSYEVKPVTRRRALRSNKSVDFQTNGNAPEVVNNSAKSPIIPNNNAELPSSLHKVYWRLLPAQVYNQSPPPPCLVYGAIHLTRLFVRLPELLNSSNIEESKLKTLLPHLDNLVEFLKDHKEWYGEKFYVDK